MIQRAVILAALLFFPTAAHATGPACCGGGGSSISANSCSVPGDFATGIATDGTLTCSTPSGGGNVSNTGTPANNQIAVWTDATTIEGDPKLTLSGSSLTLGDSAVDAGFTLATGLTGGTDPQIDFTNGQVDCANCRFTLTGGTKVIPDAGGGGVATRVPYWSDTDTLTDEAAFAYDSSTNTLTVTNVTGNASTASTASDLSNAGIDAVLPDIDGFGLSINTGTTPDELQLAPGEVTGPQVWGDGSGTMSWTFNTGITDPIIDFYNTGVVDVTGTLQMNTVPVVTTTGSQTLTNKTLTTPTIASFTNATHNHTNAAGGGTLTLAGSAFPNQGTTTTVLHGNAAGNPSWGQVSNSDLAGSISVSKTLLTDGAGLLLSTDTLSTASTEANFLANAASVTCSSSPGKLIVDTTAETLAYCDGAVGSTQKWAALGNDSGESTAAANNSVALTTDTTGNYAAGDAEAGNATGLACTTCVDATDIATGAVTSAKILDGEIANADVNASAAILFSKLATTNTDRILGRDTAGGGAVEELTVSGGLEFTGTGIQRSAFSGGDVTASAGSATLTIGADKITEAMLKVVDSPSDEECLTYESTGGDFEWQSCGSGGSGISGIAADSGGTTTGSTVTITGTGTDTTRSTDTISVDVDMTEVSLTKGSIWQGNGSNVATAYSNPSGLDVRAFGAVCDGSTDDSTAFTNCIAAVDGTDEGTCLVPATGNACVIADVTLTSNSNLVCTPGARLEAKSSVSNAMLYAASAINNVRISGCLFNLDQVEKDAVKINSGSTGITIDSNQFWWNYNSETAGTGTTAEDYIEMGCADSSSTTLGCSIRNNLIVGSNRDAQDDTGITVLGGGGIFGLGSTFLIEGNIIAGTGGDCMDLTMAGIVNANLMYGCGEAGITGTVAQGDISSNEIYVNSSGGTFTIDINASNARIVGNNFPTNTGGRGAARIYNGSGTQFENNYAADGVQYLTVAITNRTNHAAIKNNVFNVGSARDDPFDGGSAVASVIVENPSDLQVVSNSFVGTAPAGGYTAIRIQNSDTATFDVAQTRILNNIISAIGAAGTDSCMLFHDASGTANNGFINMQIVANSCGVEGSTAIDNCVKVNNVAEAGNWSDVFYSANIFDDCTTWQSGASTTNVTPQVFNSAGTSFKWEPRGMNDGFQFRSIHMMGDGNCVPAAGTGYMGPISTGGNNCNATETSVDWSVGPNQVTFTNMTCRQNEDTTCTTVFTLRDDAADTSATCTTTNVDTCAWSGTVTMAASSLAAIKMSTNTSCTTESNVECDLTFTVD